MDKVNICLHEQDYLPRDSLMFVKGFWLVLGRLFFLMTAGRTGSTCTLERFLRCDKDTEIFEMDGLLKDVGDKAL